MTDVIIVGAGIAGLTAAWELAAGGASVTLVEASDHPGGKLRAGTNVAVDVGAESFAIRTSAVTDLIADANLRLDVVAPRAGGAHLITLDDDGAVIRHPLPARTVLGLPAEPTAADVRAIIGDAAVQRASSERSFGPLTGTEPSLFDLASQRFGEVVAERLVDPLCRSVYSQPADRLRLSQVHPPAWAAFERTGSLTDAVAEVAAAAPAGAAVRGVAGGMWRLVVALRAAVEAAGVRVLTGAAATAVAPGVVQVGSDTLVAERVIVAVGSSAARALFGLAPRQDDHHVQVVTAVVRSSALRGRPLGSGAIVAPQVATRAKAVTHVTAKWEWAQDTVAEGCEVLRVSARDGANDDLADVTVLATELSLLTGLQIEPADIVIAETTMWPDAVVDRNDRTVADQAAALGIELVGAIAAGTGLAAVIPHARAVARRMLTDLPPKGPIS